MQFVAFQTFFFFPNKNEKFSHNEIEQCDIIEIKRNRCKSLRKGEKKKKSIKVQSKDPQLHKLSVISIVLFF